MTNWDFLTAELTALEHEGLLSHTRTVESAQGAWITVDGKRVLNISAPIIILAWPTTHACERPPTPPLNALV